MRFNCCVGFVEYLDADLFVLMVCLFWLLLMMRCFGVDCLEFIIVFLGKMFVRYSLCIYCF